MNEPASNDPEGMHATAWCLHIHSYTAQLTHVSIQECFIRSQTATKLS